MPEPMTPTARRWATLLDLHDATDLTTREFARAHEVNPATLLWWRSRLGRRRTTPAVAGSARSLAAPTFFEVRAEAPPPLRLALGCGRAHVLVDHDTDLDLLRRVLGALC